MGRRKQNYKIRKIIISVGSENAVLDLNDKEAFVLPKNELVQVILKMRRMYIEFKRRLAENKPEAKSNAFEKNEKKQFRNENNNKQDDSTPDDYEPINEYYGDFIYF